MTDRPENLLIPILTDKINGAAEKFRQIDHRTGANCISKN